MKHLLPVIGVFFLVSSVSYAQGYKCFTKVAEADRKEMIAHFVNKKYPEFKKSFADLCKKNSESITCKTETLKLSAAPKRMSEISKQSICAEVMRIDAGKDTTIYSMDDKGAPKRN
ncbi:hypothetical protein ACLVWU_05470 [Bdellovibrio sp. HCB290]|uniref:hypothetical protein n=1 Tax=Bdellovibrio sp. HCB290 TaxID=3394356 RepID=UPI0039B54CA7